MIAEGVGGKRSAANSTCYIAVFMEHVVPLNVVR